MTDEPVVKKTNPYNVKVGQVWRSTDPRTPSLRILVTAIEDGFAHVITQVGRPARRRKIRLDRFKAGSTGYELVSEMA